MSLLPHPAAPPRILEGRNCRFELDRPLIMGVLNVTPDSFSDGGLYRSLDQALRHGGEMRDEGADIIDVGGESTRPGAAAVSVQEELDRVIPIIEALRRELDISLSIDTNKSEVARAALAAGADFINDISGLGFDPAMAAVAGETGAGLFLMHTRGRPAEMQRNTRYSDLMGEIIDSLGKALSLAEKAGVPAQKMAVDPGIGFGKSVAGNLEILARLGELGALGRPVLLGTSRKSFIGSILNQPDPRRRLFGTLATVAIGVDKGGHIFRVHDVGPARETALMAWAVCRGSLKT
jgi:dihydropteroate synthase